MVKIGNTAEETAGDVKESKPARKMIFGKGAKKEEVIPHTASSERKLKAKQKEAKRAQKVKDESQRVKSADSAKKDNSNRAVILLGSFMTIVAIGLFIGQFILVPLFTPTNTFVFQATEDIEHGSWIEPDMLTAVEIPSEGVLPSMIVDTADLDGYASRTIQAGEPLLKSSVVATEEGVNLEEYLYTAVALAGTPVLQDGSLVNVYVRSGSNVSLLFEEPKRVYANSTIGGYTPEEGAGNVVESPNLLLTDDEFERYHEAIANQEVIVAARLHPDRRPGLVSERPESTTQEITEDTDTQDIIEDDLDISRLSDEELAQLVLQYLNTEMTLAELQSIDQIGEVRAQSIMAFIEQEGGFDSLAQLTDIEDIDDILAGRILDHIVTQLDTYGGA